MENGTYLNLTRDDLTFEELNLWTVAQDTVCDGYTPCTMYDGLQVIEVFKTKQEAIEEIESDPWFYDSEVDFVCQVKDLGHKTIYHGTRIKKKGW